jgi:hypothetical protein
MQLYVDMISGALEYAPLGWLPPNLVAISFYKTGTNPYGAVDPSPAYFSWPTTEGRATQFGSTVWWLCPLSGSDRTGKAQWQVYVGSTNFGEGGLGGLRK